MNTRNQLQIETEWNWSDNELILKSNHQQLFNIQYLQKAASFIILNSTSNVQFQLSITQSKPFLFNSKQGWYWHKSWNIPDINVKLIFPFEDDFNIQGELLSQVIFVKKCVGLQQPDFLEELGSKGKNKSQVNKLKCCFKSLKFTSTSYKHEGNKFHILVLLYIRENKFEDYKLLANKISPPILVDSRKSARNTIFQKKLRLTQVIDPFPISQFDKIFVKSCKSTSPNESNTLENNINDFFEYFTSPNIRQKVKHPFYIAVKFSKCAYLFCCSNIISTCNHQYPDILLHVQKILNEGAKFYDRSKLKQKNYQQPLYLFIQTSELKEQQVKKFLSFFKLLRLSIMRVITNISSVPEGFIKLEPDQIQHAYNQVYEKSFSKQSERQVYFKCQKSKKNFNPPEQMGQPSINDLENNSNPNQLQTKPQMQINTIDRQEKHTELVQNGQGMQVQMYQNNIQEQGCIYFQPCYLNQQSLFQLNEQNMAYIQYQQQQQQIQLGLERSFYDPRLLYYTGWMQGIEIENIQQQYWQTKQNEVNIGQKRNQNEIEERDKNKTKVENEQM